MANALQTDYVKQYLGGRSPLALEALAHKPDTQYIASDSGEVYEPHHLSETIYPRLGEIHLTFGNRKMKTIRLTNRSFDVRLVIGIVDRYGRERPYDMHLSASGESIAYSDLISYLRRDGYDPLLPVRFKDFQNGIAKMMGDEICKQIERYMTFALDSKGEIKSSNFTRETSLSVNTRLKRIADSARDKVRDYIAGGVKPPLADSTINTRNWRHKRDGRLYKHGIETALWETGTLASNIKAFIVGKIHWSDIINSIIRNIEQDKLIAHWLYKHGKNKGEYAGSMSEQTAKAATFLHNLYKGKKYYSKSKNKYIPYAQLDRLLSLKSFLENRIKGINKPSKYNLAREQNINLDMRKQDEQTLASVLDIFKNMGMLQV